MLESIEEKRSIDGSPENEEQTYAEIVRSTTPSSASAEPATNDNGRSIKLSVPVFSRES